MCLPPYCIGLQGIHRLYITSTNSISVFELVFTYSPVGGGTNCNRGPLIFHSKALCHASMNDAFYECREVAGSWLFRCSSFRCYTSVQRCVVCVRRRQNSLPPHYVFILVQMVCASGIGARIFWSSMLPAHARRIDSKPATEVCMLESMEKKQYNYPN